VPSAAAGPGPQGEGAAAPAGPARRHPDGWAAAAAKYAPAIIAAAAMAVLGVWGLARDSSMGNDEVATRWAALLSLRDLAHLLNTVDAVHGFYYLLMHGWVVVGSSPAVLRIPSVLVMIAAVAMTAILAQRLTGSGWAGLFAGLVMALTPVITYYAQTARSYAMVVACVTASTLALLGALNAEAAGATSARTARRWVLYAALVTVGGYLNELSLLVLAAHAVTVLLARYRLRVLWHWVAAAAAAAVLVLPLVVISSRENGAVRWIRRPGLTDLEILFHDYFGATTVVAVLLLACAAAAVLPPAGWWRRRRGAGAGQPGAGAAAETPWWRAGGISLPSVAVPLLVVPAGLLLAESLVARPYYVDRYVLYGEVGAALLAGTGMYRIGQWLAGAASRRALLWVPGVVLCVCTLVLQFGAQQRVRTPDSRAYDFGGPSRFVGAHAHTGDGVLFFDTFFRKARLGYPQDFTKTSDFAMAVPPQQAGNFRGRDKPVQQTGPLMLQHERIWVIGAEPSAQLPPGSYRSESMVLRDHFSLVLVRHFRGMAVTLWRRR
jgi:mannosyltransferase